MISIQDSSADSAGDYRPMGAGAVCNTEERMTHDELVEKMLEAFNHTTPEQRQGSLPSMSQRMAAALDVCLGEVLGDATLDESIWTVNRPYFLEGFRGIIAERRSRYLKPKSDPAVEAVKKFFILDYSSGGPVVASAEKIVAAVRKADKGA